MKGQVHKNGDDEVRQGHENGEEDGEEQGLGYEHTSIGLETRRTRLGMFFFFYVCLYFCSNYCFILYPQLLPPQTLPQPQEGARDVCLESLVSFSHHHHHFASTT